MSWLRVQTVVVAAVIGAAFGLALGASADAQAYGGTSPYMENPTTAERTAMREFLRRGGNPTGICGTVCDDLWLSEHRPQPNQPSSRDLHRSLYRARVKAKWLPRISSLGTVAAIAGTAYVGWQIGSGINATFLKLGPPPANAHTRYDKVQWRWDPGASSYHQYPANSWVAQFTMTGQPGAAEQVPRTQVQNCMAPVTAPAGSTPSGDRSEGVAGCPNGPHPTRGYHMPGEDSMLYPGSAPEPFTGGPNQPVHRTSPAMTGGTTAEQDQGVDECFTDPLCAQWAESNMRSGTGTQDPRGDPAPATVPDCTGVSYETCVQRLRDAGFRSFQREYADFGSADISKAACAVLTTDPAAGSQAQPDDPIRVRTNPIGNEMPIVIPAFAPAPGEGADVYVDRLRELGSNADIEVPKEADPAYGSGAVTRVSPPPGTRIRPDQDVLVTANPTATRPNNGECDRDTTRDDPGGGDPFRIEQTFQGRDPRVPLPQFRDIYLHTGRPDSSSQAGWGLRHIKPKHGWDGADDRRDTQQALYDPAPEQESPDKFQFYSFYLQDRLPCTRRTVVAYDVVPYDARAKHIITSFAHPGWFRQKDQPPGFSP